MAVELRPTVFIENTRFVEGSYTMPSGRSPVWISDSFFKLPKSNIVTVALSPFVMNPRLNSGTRTVACAPFVSAIVPRSSPVSALSTSTWVS